MTTTPAAGERRYTDERFLGLRPGELELAGAIVVGCEFVDCDLSFASFRGMDLTSWSFEGCRFAEAEFVRCVLKGVSFAGADLTRCAVHRCDLAGADLRGARGYVISPTENTLRGARVSLPEALGLLAAVGVVVE